MTSDTPISLTQSLSGDPTSQSASVEHAEFTARLHWVIAEGGLSVEREVHDWLGEDRFEALLDGAQPSLEEISEVNALAQRLQSLQDDDTATDMEPIAGQAPPAAALGSALLRNPATVTASALGVILCVSALTVAGLTLQSAEKVREEANAADAFSARLVTTLAEELPHGTPTPVFESIADDALAYFNARPDISDPQTLRDWSRVFTIVGRQRWNSGNTSGAREAFETAVSATERRLSVQPDSLNATFDHSQAVFWLADFNYRNGDFDAAEVGYDEYAGLTQRLYEAEPERPLYQAEYAYGFLNTAIIDLERGRTLEALDGFTVATERLEQLAATTDAVSQTDVANAYAWRSDSFESQGELVLAEADRAKLYEIYATAAEETSNGYLRVRKLHAASRWAQALIDLGRVSQADQIIEQALEDADRFLSEAPDSLSAQRRYLGLMLQRAEIALFEDRALAAKLILDSARGQAISQLEGQSRIMPPRELAGFYLLAADAALALGAYDAAITEGRSTLRALEEIERPDRHTAFLRARAYEVIGRAEARQGNLLMAERSWRQGLATLELGVGHFWERPVEARLLMLTGDQSAALALRAEIAEVEYAHPLDVEFWDEVAQSGLVQNTSNGDINDN